MNTIFGRGSFIRSLSRKKVKNFAGFGSMICVTPTPVGCFNQGESITYLKEQMGHHSIQVTVDLYGHLIPGANRAAANRLEAHILPKPTVSTAAQA